MIQAIIFDFDGVLVDSNHIKRDAYFKIFSEVSGSKRSIEEAIIENPKKTRYGIIEAILRKLKQRGVVDFSDLESEKERYAQKYAQKTEEETIKTKEISGAEEALKTLSQKYPLFILTSTIQKGIDKIVEDRRLIKYFRGIYGASSSDYDKSRILERIAKEHDFNPEKSVFVGDGKADYECAKYHNMRFVAILNETNDFEQREDIEYKINNLENLDELISEIDSKIS
tara:strand:- start:3765 stop:4445 length:681 start_codon:yes stop_codon:yes gene_type:complete